MVLNDMELMPHKEDWTKLVKQLLGSLGFNELWVAQTVGDVNIFLSLVKQSLHDNFIQSIHRVKKYRQAIARLRCSSDRLEIEAGRLHKPIRTPVENRKCKRCDVVENEFHFLFECPLHSELRIQYLDCYFYEHPNNFKLRQLFNSTREKHAKKTYQFSVIKLLL